MGWLQGWLHIRLHGWQGFRAELHRGLCWRSHGQGGAPICRGHPILLQKVPCWVTSSEPAHCLAQYGHETSRVRLTSYVSSGVGLRKSSMGWS